MVLLKKEASFRYGSQLSGLIKGQVHTDIIHRGAFSCDASIYQIMPKFVVVVRDAEDISAVIKYAANNYLSVTARGAGSGLAGESLTDGIVIDMTGYMNNIVGYDSKNETVTCQSGVVLDDLNDYLKPFGRKIGPDPSSSNRATVGGCVANNATGAHSLQYGYIANFVVRAQAVLSDGSIVEFTNGYRPTDEEKSTLNTIAFKCLNLIDSNREMIAGALPLTRRNRSGYNIADICHAGQIDMAKLLAGSEGTLAVLVEITLKTVELPEQKALVQFEFDSLGKMAKAVPILVDSGVTACELTDDRLVKMALDAFPQYSDILPAGAKVSLLAEQIGKDLDEVARKIRHSCEVVGSLAYRSRTFFDGQQQQRLWKSRKDAVPLLYRSKGDKKPIGFVEDTSVDCTRLDKYIEGLEAIGRKYDFTMSYYGHAGDGELHIRPMLDLGRAEDVKKMRAIADEVYALAWSLGGSISGEHADGLVRASYIKKQYGQQYYQLLWDIKNIFDPTGFINPGKILNNDPDIMVKNLRGRFEYNEERLKSELFFDADELRFETGQCNGCGLCLSNRSDLRLCPVHRAMKDEIGSSRAKVNLLRLWMTGQLSDEDFSSDEFGKFLSLCVNCKACSLQCPSGVDVSKLMIAARVKYAKRNGIKLGQRILSLNRYMAILNGMFAPISGFVMRLGLFRNLLEKITGIDKKRKMPDFNRASFLKAGRKYLASVEPIEKPIERVAYFVDTYANYNDPQLGFDVIKCLRHNDIEVILPDQRPAPLPAIVYGDVKTARSQLQYSVKYLAKAVKAGYKIVCSEPSAAMCLKKELRLFVDSEDARLVSENVYELMGFLLELFKQGKLKPALKQKTEKFLYHSPCHLLAIERSKASIELLKGQCSAEVIDLNAGCCGIAGTFGMQKKNVLLSDKISENLTKALADSDIKTVLSECSTCRMQIEHISDSKAIHPIKVLAKAWDLL